MKVLFLISTILILNVKAVTAFAADCTNSADIEAAAMQRTADLSGQYPTGPATIRFDGIASGGLYDNYEVSVYATNSRYCVATVLVQTKHNTCNVVSAGDTSDSYGCD